METFSRPPSARQQRLRRPRGLVGTPLRRRPRPGQRAVLRLLRLGRHHDARGARPARARAGPADDRLLLPPDPARALVPVLTAMPAAGIPLGDILADSGYAHRDAEAWAIPLRQAGAQLVQDLHPSDRGPRGTHHGAIIANGNLYCPATPRPLLELGPLARDATPDQAAAHDQQTAETARLQARPDHQRRRRRLPPGDVPRGHGQDPLPAPPGIDDAGPATGPRSSPRPGTRPPAAPSRPSPSRPRRAAKTRQKHDYPSAAHRRSYARRTGAERTFSTAKDPASNNIARGWSRLMGLAPLMLWLACLLTVRNQRILDRLGRPPGRQRPPRRGRPAPRDPPPAPQDPRQPGHRRHRHNPGTTQPRGRHRHTPDHPDHGTTSQPAARNSHGRQATAPEPGSSREHTRRARKCQTQT